MQGDTVRVADVNSVSADMVGLTGILHGTASGNLWIHVEDILCKDMVDAHYGSPCNCFWYGPFVEDEIEKV